MPEAVIILAYFYLQVKLLAFRRKIMIILFKANKTLSVTSKSVILQGENLADKLNFYIPTTYEEITFSEPDVTLFYKDAGKNVHSVKLSSAAEDKNGFLKYTLPLSNALTENAGELELWLEIVNSTTDSGVTETTTSIIHSFSTTLTVHEWDSYSLNATVTELEGKIDALSTKIDELISKVDPTISA